AANRVEDNDTAFHHPSNGSHSAATAGLNTTGSGSTGPARNALAAATTSRHPSTNRNAAMIPTRAEQLSATSMARAVTVVATTKTMGTARQMSARPVRFSRTVAVSSANPARSWSAAPKTGPTARHAGTGFPAASFSVMDNRIAGKARVASVATQRTRSEEHTSELQSRENLVCR